MSLPVESPIIADAVYADEAKRTERPPMPPGCRRSRPEAIPGGALVWDHHAAGDQTGQLRECQRGYRTNRAIRSGLQQDQGPIPMERNGRLNPGEAAATLLVDLRDAIPGRSPGSPSPAEPGCGDEQLDAGGSPG